MLTTLFYAAGYISGVLAFILMAKRRRLLTDGVLSLMATALIGGLACAAIGQLIAVQAPGKSVIAGIAGGYASVVIAKRVMGIRRPLGDLFAVALAAGEAVGRWGCFFAGCCYGVPCRLPWAVYQHGAFRHPTQIYTSIASVGILAVLIALERRKPPENTLFCVQGLLFCAARFCIEFLREGPRLPGGLTAAQWACLAGLALFAVLMHRVLHPPVGAACAPMAQGALGAGTVSPAGSTWA